MFLYEIENHIIVNIRYFVCVNERVVYISLKKCFSALQQRCGLMVFNATFNII